MMWAMSMALLTFLTGTGMSFIIEQPLADLPITRNLAVISHPSPNTSPEPSLPSFPPTATATHIAPTSTPPPVASTATPSPRPTAPPMPTATPSPYTPTGPQPTGNDAIPTQGQVILVSLAQQWLWVYRNGQMVYDTPVTTGSPQQPTPDGTYHVLYEQQNLWFTSPWSKTSPYYYSPEFVHYAMYFRNTGFYIHDAPWRQQFGPGTNYPHTESNGASTTGSHGCIEVPTPAGAWLYAFAKAYTTIIIYGTAPVNTPQPAATPTSVAMPVITPTATATMAPTATATIAPTVSAISIVTMTPVASSTASPTVTPAATP